MAAGVHLAGIDRDVVEVIVLVDIESVEISAQADGPSTAGTAAAVKHADNAGGGDAGVDLHAEGF